MVKRKNKKRLWKEIKNWSRVIGILFLVIWLLAFPFIILFYSLDKGDVFLIVVSIINLTMFGVTIKIVENGVLK